jgi:hypothetical protein
MGLKKKFLLKQRQSARREVELELRGLRRRNSPDMDSVLDDDGPGIQVYRPTSAGLLPLSGSRGSIGSNGSYELFVAQSSVPDAK